MSFCRYFVCILLLEYHVKNVSLMLFVLISFIYRIVTMPFNWNLPNAATLGKGKHVSVHSIVINR